MQKKNLYFIALIPQYKIRRIVKTLKEEMKTKFNAKHALKSPAHITLQMPFKRRVGDEQLIIDVLSAFAICQQPFTVKLFGFGSFAPRVIYIKVMNHLPIISLHIALNKVLINQLGFLRNEINAKYHPHMTIATRDLTKQFFSRAWAAFKNRDFNAVFTVQSLFLLKHNGKCWDMFQTFSFKG